MTPDQIARLPYRRCVGIVLANAQGRIFAGQRIDWPEPAWQMPQGGIDEGETAEAAALRELEEETGVTPSLVRIEAETADWLAYDLPVEIIPDRWGGRFRGQKQKWFLMRFLGDDNEIKINTQHPEFSRWNWTAADDLVAQIVPFKREVYQRVVAEFGSKL